MPAENNRGVLVSSTLADINAFEQNTRERLQQAAINSSDVDANTPDGITVRQLLPDEDLASGADNDWSDTPEWAQSGMSTDSYNTTYEVDSNNEAESKIVAVFAITNTAADPGTTEIKFSTSTGGEFERLQIEGLLTDEEDTLLLTDPVVFGATESGTIEQWSSTASDGIILHGIVAESVSETLEASQRFLSDL